MLEQLAQLLKTRKGKYILFLGAGASLSSGEVSIEEHPTSALRMPLIVDRIGKEFVI